MLSYAHRALIVRTCAPVLCYDQFPELGVFRQNRCPGDPLRRRGGVASRVPVAVYRQEDRKGRHRHGLAQTPRAHGGRQHAVYLKRRLIATIQVGGFFSLH